jgi:hypothetical protein
MKLPQPNDSLRRINLKDMNYLETLEITTDYIYDNFDKYEHSYSEFSAGVSMGNDSDGGYCKGIDYSQL